MASNDLLSASGDPEGPSMNSLAEAVARTGSDVDPLQQLVQLCQQQVKDAARREEKMAQLLEMALKKEARQTKVQPSEADNQMLTASSKVNVTPPPLSANMTVTEFLAWKDAWKDYKLCQKLNSLDKETKVAAMRQCLDEDLKRYLRQGIIQTPTNPDDDDYLLALEKYARKQRNPLLDRIDFYNYQQDAGEPFDSYFSTLKELYKACDFPVDTLCTGCTSTVQACGSCKGILERLQDEVLRDRIVTGIRNQETRHHLLATPHLTLEAAVRICASEEAARVTQHDIETNATSKVQAVRKSRYQKAKHSTSRPQPLKADGRDLRDRPRENVSSTSKGSYECRSCGYFHPREAKCPAEGKECRLCGGIGHFQKVCSQYRHTIEPNRLSHLRVHRLASEENTVDILTELTSTPGSMRKIRWLPDTGSDIDAIGPADLERLGCCVNDLEPDNLVVTNANGDTLQALGQAEVKLTLPSADIHHKSVLHVYDGVSHPLLSLNSLKALRYLPQEWPHQCAELSTIPMKPIENPTGQDIRRIKQQLLEEFSDVFDSASTELPPMLCKPMEIHLRPDAKPFAVHSARNIPHAYKSRVKDQLDEMVQKGIIESVAGASEWCHPIVVVEKKGTDEVRLTVDLTKLNKQVERPVHPMNTTKEAIANIQKARYFTTLDARHGYWQVPLEDNSRHLTTFITPWGRYRYLRNPQGFIAAGDEFNVRTDAAFDGIPNFSKVVDDCLKYDVTFNDHVQHIRQVLTRARKHGITFSEKKFEFAREEVNFCGYLVGTNGWKIHPEKISAVKDFPIPLNRTDLRSFMGLVNQFTEFSSDLAKAAEPLRGLLKESNEFLWLPEHSTAMESVKQELLKAPTLSFYQLGAPLRLETDASRTQGLGFALLQLQNDKWRLIQCGSRFISETESRYAMIELECLAVVWAVAKCKTFLAGVHFEVITDHKPLVPILNKYSLNQIENPRLLRLIMKLQMFQFKTEWRKGKEHFIADALSRAPVNSPIEADLIAEDVPHGNLEEFPAHTAIRMLSENALAIPAMKRDALLEAIAADDHYLKLAKTVTDGFPRRHDTLSADIKPFWNMREHLWIDDGIVMKGQCIVVPLKLRHSVLADLHASHQGQERTKKRARQTVYWPGIGNDIDNTVRSCTHCRQRQPSLPKEPMQSEPAPQFPFQVACTDLFSCQGTQYLVYVDVKSGWPLVYSLGSSTTTNDVVIPLRRWFAEVGVPEKLKTDGGPQFSSKRFKDFCQRWQVMHQMSSPHYPQANGHAEAAVKCVKNLIYKTTTNGNLDCDAFQRGILEFRNTPRADGLSPAQILYGRPISSFLLANHRMFSEEYQKKANEVDFNCKSRRTKNEEHYNKTAHPLSELDTGTKVDVQNHRTKEWTATGTVVAIGRNRDYYVKMPSGRVYWRNRRFLRPYLSSIPVRVQQDPLPQKPACTSVVPSQIQPDVDSSNPPQVLDNNTRHSSRQKLPWSRFNITSTKGQSYD